MKDHGGVWEHRSDYPFAGFYKPEAPVFFGTGDLRTLGVSVASPGLGIEAALWRDSGPNPAPRGYREFEEAGLRVVESRNDAGTRRWYIDPAKGWGAVRVIFENRAGETISESRSVLKLYGDVWFPSTASFYTKRFKGGKEPCEIIRVQRAVFNDPNLPTRFKPEDIGIEVGTNIRVYLKNRTKPDDLAFWDGSKLISQTEYLERLRSGELVEGPGFQKMISDLSAAEWERALKSTQKRGASSYVQQSEWEKYTRNFISSYELDPDQAQKALAILADCQQQAEQYSSKHSAEFDALNQAYKKARSSPPDAGDQADVDRKRDQLARPIVDMFEKQLVPRLDKLPTRAQREAFEKERPEAARDRSPQGQDHPQSTTRPAEKLSETP